MSMTYDAPENAKLREMLETLRAENAALANLLESSRKGGCNCRKEIPDEEQGHDTYCPEQSALLAEGYCKRIRELQAENAAQAETVRAMREAIEQLESNCPRCEGNGLLWADGKAHYATYQGPKQGCPDCDSSGRIIDIGLIQTVLATPLSHSEKIAKLKDDVLKAAEDLCPSEPTFEDERISYVEVQVERKALKDFRDALDAYKSAREAK